jgi:hypothetical protein
VYLAKTQYLSLRQKALDFKSSINAARNHLDTASKWEDSSLKHRPTLR